MAISNSMKFTIHTLIDVTKTDVRRHEHPKLVNQQANFNTLYNTLGLRTNPINFIVTQELTALQKYKFGSSYKLIYICFIGSNLTTNHILLIHCSCKIFLQ